MSRVSILFNGTFLSVAYHKMADKKAVIGYVFEVRNPSGFWLIIGSIEMTDFELLGGSPDEDWTKSGRLEEWVYG